MLNSTGYQRGISPTNSIYFLRFEVDQCPCTKGCVHLMHVHGGAHTVETTVFASGVQPWDPAESG